MMSNSGAELPAQPLKYHRQTVFSGTDELFSKFVAAEFFDRKFSGTNGMGFAVFPFHLASHCTEYLPQLIDPVGIIPGFQCQCSLEFQRRAALGKVGLLWNQAVYPIYLPH